MNYSAGPFTGMNSCYFDVFFYCIDLDHRKCFIRIDLKEFQ